ncbi:quinonprotein alcohol dehydrogenase [Lysinibacillus yapensis]|uniref:Quinonprotein alcohol dehydrogenase n=1 Tax=Ureibacillus yapensis TaxID=2304605 RepID=A0A396SCC9_9BACL|nr:PQQ-binding-like beta-propeller repeat protein [Lysinibacillus yapensis]RHW39303.1 quinonprotein alcohol dehydrogenase [Lysinibacillus yapensis]
MRVSFSKMVLFGFLAFIMICGLAFYAGVLTKQSLEDYKEDEKSPHLVVRDTAEEKTSDSKSSSQPHIKVDYANEEWTTHGGDYFNRRFSELDQINIETINQLKPEWVTSLGSSLDMKFSGEATPVVVDGVMYIATAENDVLALDAKTGEKIWEYRPQIEEKLDTVCCGWTTRGVTVGEGLVFAGLLDARLVALDQKTWEVVWETEVANWEEGYTITSTPLYYNGKVYTGVSGGEYGIRGRIMAYDAEYGHEVWRWYTIPAPGEENGDTWPDDEHKNWLHGGAPVWNTPAVDPELGYIYFVTGNTSPDLDGSKREGDNLYANSIVALNAETGEYIWHFQQVHHDIWDLDPTNPVILFDVGINGETRKALGEAGKTGWIYFLDRTNGEPLIGIEEKEVPQLAEQKTSPTQPFPKGDSFVPQGLTEEDVKRDLGEAFEGKFGSIFTPFWDEPITLKPSAFGGANWPPSAYSPETEYFYVLGTDAYVALSRQDEDAYEEGGMWIGSIFVPVNDAPVKGTITAMDVKTNTVAWQVVWDTNAYSGVLATAGDLIFVGHNDGRLIAFNAKTGEEVWSYKMDAGANAPSVTYEIDGEQYLSIFAAGNSLAGSVHGDKVYTFKLDGKWNGKPLDASEVSKGQQAAKAEKGEDTTGKTADTYDLGFSVYEGNCLSCHGNMGENGHNGPNLQLSEFAESYANVIDRVKNGGTTMPAFEANLSEEEIAAVAKNVNEVLTKADE